MGSLSGTAVGEYVRMECGPIVGYGETLDPADSKLWFEVEGQRLEVQIGTDAESRARFSGSSDLRWVSCVQPAGDEQAA